mgnify:CR=1 FL=1|jgi:hypothetical protein
MLKLVDSHDLKSCGFSRPSSSLGEATLRSNIAEPVDTKDFVFNASTKKNQEKLYTNHLRHRLRYDMLYTI